MSICLPFLLYVCGFFSKDHAYTSIEDSMAIGDPRVLEKSWANPHRNWHFDWIFYDVTIKLTRFTQQ